MATMLTLRAKNWPTRRFPPTRPFWDALRLEFQTFFKGGSIVLTPVLPRSGHAIFCKVGRALQVFLANIATVSISFYVPR